MTEIKFTNSISKFLGNSFSVFISYASTNELDSCFFVLIMRRRIRVTDFTYFNNYYLYTYFARFIVKINFRLRNSGISEITFCARNFQFSNRRFLKTKLVLSHFLNETHYFCLGSAGLLWVVMWFKEVKNEPKDDPKITENELRKIQSSVGDNHEGKVSS